MRYYSTQRPVGPGTYPKPQGNAVKEVFNFDGKTYCKEIGREAWGIHRVSGSDYTGICRNIGAEFSGWI